MLKKENILTKDKDFDKVFKKGRSSYDKIIGTKIIFNSLETNRFGIILGKKVSKRAVDRNRIKRQIREAIKKQLKTLKRGNDILILTLPGLIDAKNEDIESSIIKHFKKLKLYQ